MVDVVSISAAAEADALFAPDVIDVALAVYLGWIAWGWQWRNDRRWVARRKAAWFHITVVEGYKRRGM